MEERSMPIGKVITGVIGAILVAVLLIFSGKIFENVGADEIVVIQDPIDGELHWYTTPGIKYQNFGKSTHYPKSFQYWFSEKTDQGEDGNQSIKIRFNDGGHAMISGSVRCDLPLDDQHLTLIHMKYGSADALEHEMIRTVYEKAVYMSGPLMSSKESYAEKRNELINFIEDQAGLGVYKTQSREDKGIDPMTGVQKTITVVELVRDSSAKGGIARQEDSPLATFGIHTYNLSINSIKYDENVEAQITTQQKAIMQVQTAIAEAKQAEQKAITAEKEGQAEAAKAKWEQEVIKAKVVTEAEQNKEVAKLDKEAAVFKKEEQILLGQGEAERKRLVMNADGALERKLETYERVMGRYSEAIGKQKWVPEVEFNNAGNGQKQSNAAQDLLQMFSVKTAKDLSLDLGVKSNK